MTGNKKERTKEEMKGFPISLKQFTKMQSRLSGRRLSQDEREAVAAWMPALNSSYEDGRRGNKAALRDSLAYIDSLRQRRADSQCLFHLYGAVRYWIAAAWMQGKRDSVGVMGAVVPRKRRIVHSRFPCA